MPFYNDNKIFGPQADHFLSQHLQVIGDACLDARDAILESRTLANPSDHLEVYKVRKNKAIAEDVSILAIDTGGPEGIEYFAIPNAHVAPGSRAEGGSGVFKPLRRIVLNEVKNDAGEVIDNEMSWAPLDETLQGFKRMKVASEYNGSKDRADKAIENGELEYDILVGLGRKASLFYLENDDGVLKQYLMTEYYREGDLFEYIEDVSDVLAQSDEIALLNDLEMIQWVRQFLEEIVALHDLGYLHRDIKLENFCLDHEDNLKLIDLGLAVKIDDAQLKDPCGSKGYLAPEINFYLTPPPTVYQYDLKTEAYAAGISLKKMVSVLAQNPETRHAATLDGFIKGMLRTDPTKRSACEDVLEGIKTLEATIRRNSVHAEALSRRTSSVSSFSSVETSVRTGGYSDSSRSSTPSASRSSRREKQKPPVTIACSQLSGMKAIDDDFYQKAQSAIGSIDTIQALHHFIEMTGEETRLIENLRPTSNTPERQMAFRQLVLSAVERASILTSNASSLSSEEHVSFQALQTAVTVNHPLFPQSRRESLSRQGSSSRRGSMSSLMSAFGKFKAVDPVTEVFTDIKTLFAQANNGLRHTASLSSLEANVPPQTKVPKGKG